jgi:lambda family phage portal protein
MSRASRALAKQGPPMIRQTVLDRLVSWASPERGLRRLRSRIAGAVIARHYEAAATGRRTAGWRRNSGDPNATTGPAISRTRDVARDLVRNNGIAESAVRSIANDVCGRYGITAKPENRSKAIAREWARWADSTECDSDGRNDLAGLQRLVMRSVVIDGEVLVRRRMRRREDGLAIPLQLQVLECDYIDTLKFGSVELRRATGEVVGRNVIINGIEFDVLGRRAAYWLFREHPGDIFGRFTAQSYRVPAESILHVYRQDRPGQVRGISWLAPVALKFKDFDEFDDATLVKQKVAACLAVFVKDDGSAGPLGVAEAGADGGLDLDALEPGLVHNLAPGRDVTVVDPPATKEYADYVATLLRMIGTGIGVTYEDLTGDYTKVNFSSSRMSRLAHWGAVEEWRWLMLRPQFLDPVWLWAQEASAIMGGAGDPEVRAVWTAPAAAFVDPDKEGQAMIRNIRGGVQSYDEALRERGYDPDRTREEIAAHNDRVDELKLILDSDPRNTSQQGQARQAGLTSGANVSTFEDPPEPKTPAAAPTDGSGEDGAAAGAGGDDEDDDEADDE